MAVLRYLFQGAQDTLPCPDAADVDDDGRVGPADTLALLQHLFLQGPRLGPGDLVSGCWFDATDDALGCPGSEACHPVGVFLTLDRSGSMREARKFERLQVLAIQVLFRLRDGDAFGIIFFDSGIRQLPASGEPAVAGPAMTTGALAWTMSIQPASGTCPRQALLAALEMAEKAATKRKLILHVSDGFSYCLRNASPSTYEQETLRAVRERNFQAIPIHTVFVGREGEPGEEFLEALAAQNGGQAARIPVR